MIADICGQIHTQYMISLGLLILVCGLSIYALWKTTRVEQLERYIARKEKESNAEFRWLKE